jgi:hypothetical protein
MARAGARRWCRHFTQPGEGQSPRRGRRSRHPSPGPAVLPELKSWRTTSAASPDRCSRATSRSPCRARHEASRRPGEDGKRDRADERWWPRRGPSRSWPPARRWPTRAASSRSPSRRSPNWTPAAPSTPSPGSRSRSCRCWPRSVLLVVARERTVRALAGARDGWSVTQGRSPPCCSSRSQRRCCATGSPDSSIAEGARLPERTPADHLAGRRGRLGD